MKKFTLSAIIFYTLLHTTAYAQQTSGTTSTNKPIIKTSDPGKLTEKEISVEVNAGKSDIFLDNNSRTIEVKTWNQPKVKVSTKVYASGASSLTDQEWFDKLNLSVKEVGGAVQITSRYISGAAFYTSAGSGSYSSGSTTISSTNVTGLPVFDAEGRNVGTLSNATRTVTVFIPEGNKLEIDNQYGKMQLTGNPQNVNIKSSNGSVEAGNINRLVIRSRFTPIVLGNVKDAEIEIANGRLKAGNIDKLDIDSKYSTVEIAAVNDLMLRSANDEYEIENAGDIRGRKTFGNLRIYNLQTSMDIDGANADIKVKNLSAAVETIKINNKYADLRLPVNNIKNYEVKLIGRYNTVYAPFEKKPIADTINKSIVSRLSGTAVGSAQASTSATGDSKTSVSFADAIEANGFTAEVGNIKGKHTKFVINCASCTVDFK